LGLKNTIWFYSTAIDVVVIDQVTKYLARQSLAHKVVTLIPGLLDLRLAFNTGAAFSVLPNWAPLFILIGLVAIYAIVKLRRVGSGSLWASLGLGMLLGGAMGNLIDRIAFPGRGVTDFIDLHVGHNAWPTFNIADVAIVIGALLVLFHVYIIEKRRSEAGDEQVPNDGHDQDQTTD
jgi:signal peptidase II